MALDLLRAAYLLYGDCYEDNNVIYIGNKKATQVQLDAITARAITEEFSNAVKSKSKELYTAYETANELDISYMTTTFQADKKSQDLIVSVLSAGVVPAGFFWVDSLNNQVPMTYVELQGLSGSILTRNQVNFAKLQTLKATVGNALTQADLDLIKW